MNILYHLHFLIPLSILLMPLLPNKYLFYVFPYPIIYYFIWLYYGGCPITLINIKSGPGPNLKYGASDAKIIIHEIINIDKNIFNTKQILILFNCFINYLIIYILCICNCLYKFNNIFYNHIIIYMPI